MILLDTNILLRFANPIDPAHPVVHKVIVHLLTHGETLCVVPQNVYEFWVVATRPLTNNGLGLSIVECETEVANILAVFQFLSDSSAIYTEWSALVLRHQCRGKVAHDARLVAAMQVHGIASLLTFNSIDFLRYPTINVLEPLAIASSLP
ncbi:MAG TPA: type II toxin-antitoxin system VapC family toxin [Urbifossiella sp.]|nr:type II toxin-antitoxin system VapC family toxin [Urbifossiella sp.]